MGHESVPFMRKGEDYMFMERLTYLEDKEKTPLFADINTLLDIQEKFGSIDEWIERLGAEEGKTDYNVMRWTVMTFINEGITLENIETGKEKEQVTERYAGALISAYGAAKMMKKIIEAYANCMGEDEEEDPNLMARERQR